MEFLLPPNDSGRSFAVRHPVALDTLALKELDRVRHTLDAPAFKPNLELYSNAALLQLGVNDPAKILVEKIQ